LRPARSLSVSGSYTYTRATNDRDLDVRGVFDVYSVPRHTFTLVASQRIGERAAIALDVVGNSSYLTPFLLSGRAYRYPAFTKSDLSGSYGVALGGRARLYTRIENLFNQTYYDGGYFSPGTVFAAGLSFQY